MPGLAAEQGVTKIVSESYGAKNVANTTPVSPTKSPSSSSTSTALPPSSTTAPQDPDLTKDVTQVLKDALESTMSVQETKSGSVDEKVSSGKNTIQELFVGEALRQQEENLAAVAEGERAGIVQNLKGSVTITAINNIKDESGEITADADITVASKLSIASQSGALEGGRSSQVNKIALRNLSPR